MKKSTRSTSSSTQYRRSEETYSSDEDSNTISKTAKRNRSSGNDDHSTTKVTLESSSEAIEISNRPNEEYDLDSADLDDRYKNTFKVTEKEAHRWQSIPPEIRAQCFKSVMRYCIFKGLRKEQIVRSAIADILDKIDHSYRNHVSVILEEVRCRLKSDLGLQIINDGDIVKSDEKDKNKSKGCYYMRTCIPSKKYLKKIAEKRPDACYQGFVFVVMFAIFASTSYTIEANELLQRLRKIDSRFMDMTSKISKASSASDACIPELGADFWELMARMKKEGYITEEKSSEGRDKIRYGYGPRFAIELGKVRLVKSYYQTIGEPVDTHLLNAILKADQKEVEDGVSA